MWIYEHKEWPNFTWDTGVVTTILADIRYRQGCLLGKMDHIGFDLKNEASIRILTEDVVKSSAIEGEYLDPEEVRSSIARRLGVNMAGLIPASRDVEGIVEVMLDATQQCSAPLTAKRLYNWHAALFPTGRSGMHLITVGGWRKAESGAMQVVSGPIGRETVHFEAPEAKRLGHEMQDFLTWFNKQHSVDPVLKAGIAHLWFVTIHPFEDGNGRIARAIGDMALARADGVSDRFYSLSSQIEAERKHYYTELEKQQRHSPDITGWLVWFLECLGRALHASEHTLSHILFKVRIWDKANKYAINERQRYILNRMLEETFEGYMNTAKYAKMAKCSKDTALRDMQELKSYGIFIQNAAGGRSTSYRLPGGQEISG